MKDIRPPRIFSIFPVIAALVFLSGSVFAELSLYKNPNLPVEQRVEDLLKKMTLEEKIAQVAGADHMDTPLNKRLGIPALKMTDGPHGVRWGTSTCFPPLVTLGSSWDPVLLRAVGKALGRETRAKGRNVILGPCINIHRTPLGGRNFESFGEDPYLISELVVEYVKGVQSEKIGTSTKHFACNNQEFERTTISVEIDERTLREIYLPGFEAAVKEADTLTVMGAYNKVNGDYCCANHHLLTDILKNDWGFTGLVVSDWGAVHSTVKTANAGLDLEMPGPPRYYGDNLLRAVKNGEVSEKVLDDKVRRILRVMFKLGLFDNPDPKLKGACDTKEHRALAREAARRGIVLLKNNNETLPIDRNKVKSIAVIGPKTDASLLGGGGSSSITPNHAVTPLDGLTEKCRDGKIKLNFARGCSMPGNLVPVDFGEFTTPGPNPQPGLKAEFFNNTELTGIPVLTRVDRNINFDWDGSSPGSGLGANNFSARWTGNFTPSKSGEYDLGLLSDDGSRLYIDGKLVVNNWAEHGPETRRGTIYLEGGKACDIRVEMFEKGGNALVKLGYSPEGNVLLDEAVKVASKSDIAIVFAGISWEIEGEGVDKQDMKLPKHQDELIKAVAAANKNTVVVLINGTPLLMEEWIDDVPSVVEALYGGQEGGDAIADILFGDVNPSGRLTVTFPKKIEDSPSYKNYPGAGGKIYYEEGIFVGYRYFDRENIEPLFPFGHGLSYTAFKYDNLNITKGSDKIAATASVDITNTGKREGAEVVQLYVQDPECSVERPVKELKGFKRINLKPGETETVTFELTKRDLSFYDVKSKSWVAEPGTFNVLIGGSSRDIRQEGSFEL
ncbi:glycoside hydrolase family 3 C-terminal domain-containing protein [bacterium]|jgi:beta-glucosidase|nr:glycoside hydrolase family 3 C-terminal domain-containing protein [bacterium]